MIILDGPAATGLTPRALPDPAEPEPATTFGRVLPSGAREPGILEAAFGMESDVVATIDHFTRPTFKTEPDHNPLDVIKGTRYETDYLDNFVGARSEAETRSIMSRIDREEAYRDTLARGGWKAQVSQMAAGILSPTMLVPLGGFIRAGSKVGRVAIRAAEGAALTGATVAGQEAILQGTQETRTTLESVFNIGISTIIGGVLGGGVATLTKGRLDEIGEAVEKGLPATLADDRRMFDEAVKASGVGAQATDAARGSGELAGALGVEKAVSFQDPLFRLHTSFLEASRNAVRDVAESPLSLAENSAGIPTSVGGAVETLVKMSEAPLAEALGDVDEAFQTYFFGSKRMFAPMRASLARVAGKSSKMTYAEFKEEVTRAALAGDVHPVPEVQKAAQAVRAKVFEPYKKEAIEAGLFGKDVGPLDDTGYVHRIYNTEAIRSRRAEFSDILTRHFAARQKELFERVGDLEARTGAAEVEVATEYTEAEIRSIADEATDTILGFSPQRVILPADLIAGPRGPLKERVLRIPTNLIWDFVEKDIGVIARRYTRTMAADVGLWKKFGSTDLVDQINKINDEAAQKSKAARSEKESRRIAKQQASDIRDISAIRDRIRGTYAIPDNPDGLLVRTGRVVRNLNYARLLGGMQLSAIPDPARIMMTHGLSRTMRTAWHPFVRGLKTFKLAAKEAKLAGTALDMILDTRAMAISDIMDDYGRGSKFERGVQYTANKFGLVSLMAPWNAAMKQFAGIVGQTRMLQGIEKLVAGKAAKKEIEYLAAGGIDANMAERIGGMFKAHGVKDGDVWWANTQAWTDRQAVQSFRAFMVRDIDRAIITPGQDKPLWMSTELGKIIGQFRSFNVASMQRTVVSGLQQRDMAAFNGMLFMLALGALTYKVKMDVAGGEVSDDPAVWATEAFDRSGLAGWITDVNNIAEKTALRPFTMAGLTGAPASRYASRNVYGALFGPTADVIGDVVPLGMTGEWAAADTRAARKMIPLQNLWYLRQLFDKAEAGFNSAFGVPARRQ